MLLIMEQRPLITHCFILMIIDHRVRASSVRDIMVTDVRNGQNDTSSNLKQD